MCETNGPLAVEAALEVFARLIELLSEGEVIDSAEVLKLAEIAKKHVRARE
jgi:hypothetical protein